MYAVFQIGNKQYKALLGKIISVERMDADIGNQIELNQVLLIKKDDIVQIGEPFIKNGRVIAKVLNHILDKKIEIIKFRRRKHFCKFKGHRQYITQLSILDIQGG